MTDHDDITDLPRWRHSFSWWPLFSVWIVTTSHIKSASILDSMRLPSVSTLARTFYTFTNAARLRPSPQRITSPVLRSSIVWSMPTIPILGSFFGSSSSSAKMTYPDQRSDQEWQAVLNKGLNYPLYLCGGCICLSTDFLYPPPRTISDFARKGHRSS